MLLQTVRPNIVQAIRAYRVDDLMQAIKYVNVATQTVGVWPSGS